MPARGSYTFFRYTTTGHGDDGVGSICFEGYLLGTRSLGAEATGWVSFVLKDIYLVHDHRAQGRRGGFLL